jgi:hypothetical protein
MRARGGRVLHSSRASNCTAANASTLWTELGGRTPQQSSFSFPARKPARVTVRLSAQCKPHSSGPTRRRGIKGLTAACTAGGMGSPREMLQESRARSSRTSSCTEALCERNECAMPNDERRPALRQRVPRLLEARLTTGSRRGGRAVQRLCIVRVLAPGVCTKQQKRRQQLAASGKQQPVPLRLNASGKPRATDRRCCGGSAKSRTHPTQCRSRSQAQLWSARHTAPAAPTKPRSSSNE